MWDCCKINRDKMYVVEVLPCSALFNGTSVPQGLRAGERRRSADTYQRARGSTPTSANTSSQHRHDTRFTRLTDATAKIVVSGEWPRVKGFKCQSGFLSSTTARSYVKPFVKRWNGTRAGKCAARQPMGERG